MGTIDVIRRKLKSFQRLSAFEKSWLLPAWFLLGASRALIAVVPFGKLAPKLGSNAQKSPWIPLLDHSQTSTALRVGRVVRLAARYTPWKSDCYPQAITARLLLGFYGVPYALFFGVARSASDETMLAHAWIAAGRVRVTGGAACRRYTAVACFVGPLSTDGTTG